jgi:hypothetical protein
VKAKEYAKEFFKSIEGAKSQDRIDEAMRATINRFVDEFYVLIKERNIQTPRAIVSAFKELQSKWVALCERMIDSKGRSLLKEEGLFMLIKKSSPELWELYQNCLCTVNVKKRMGWK